MQTQLFQIRLVVSVSRYYCDQKKKKKQRNLSALLYYYMYILLLTKTRNPHRCSLKRECE